MTRDELLAMVACLADAAALDVHDEELAQRLRAIPAEPRPICLVFSPPADHWLGAHQESIRRDLRHLSDLIGVPCIIVPGGWTVQAVVDPRSRAEINRAEYQSLWAQLHAPGGPGDSAAAAADPAK